jgi:hypothetical protein
MRLLIAWYNLLRAKAIFSQTEPIPVMFFRFIALSAALLCLSIEQVNASLSTQNVAHNLLSDIAWYLPAPGAQAEPYQQEAQALQQALHYAAANSARVDEAVDVEASALFARTYSWFKTNHEALVQSKAYRYHHAPFYNQMLENLEDYFAIRHNEQEQATVIKQGQQLRNATPERTLITQQLHSRVQKRLTADQLHQRMQAKKRSGAGIGLCAGIALPLGIATLSGALTLISVKKRKKRSITQLSRTVKQEGDSFHQPL